MAKRFTDTSKWNKAWFRKLPVRLKCAWLFLCDNCDHAGVWDLDQDAFRYFLGEDVLVEELIETFDVIKVGKNKIFLPGFIAFQYGKLNPANKVHQSVLSILEKYEINLIEIAKNKDLASPLQGAKDKDKDKDKVKDKEKDKDKDPVFISSTAKFENSFKFDFKNLLANYPNHRKTNISVDLLAAKIRTQADYNRLTLAIANYRAHCEKVGTEFRFTMQFPNFLNEWEDWENSDLTKNKFEKKNGIQEWLEQQGVKDEPA